MNNSLISVLNYILCTRNTCTLRSVPTGALVFLCLEKESKMQCAIHAYTMYLVGMHTWCSLILFDSFMHLYICYNT